MSRQCGGVGRFLSPSPFSRSPPAAVTAAKSRRFRAIHELARERPGELRAAALEQLRSGESNIRYAAVYALSLTAEDESLEALRPLLESTETSERMLAASSLVSQGEKAALPVLVEALGSRAVRMGLSCTAAGRRRSRR